MYLTQQLKKVLLKHLMNATWQGIAVFLLLYSIAAWILLYLAGEHKITQDPVDFIYWLIVTSSTVGYGDISPQSDLGKLVSSVIIIPIGLALFALILGRIAGFIVTYWKKADLGMKPMNGSDHIVVIGWNGQKTQQLLTLLIAESKENRQRDILLCCQNEQLETNPLPDQIHFIKADVYNTDVTVKQTNITQASCIIIDTPLDDVTLTTALYMHKRNPDAHLIAYFEDENLASLLKEHCPNAECIPSVSVEMLAKSAMDPGSSRLHHELLNATKGMTQYSCTLSSIEKPLCIQEFFAYFKEHYNATVIALRHHDSQQLIINPATRIPTEKGDTLYYIADNRIANAQIQAAIEDIYKNNQN